MKYLRANVILETKLQKEKQKCWVSPAYTLISENLSFGTLRNPFRLPLGITKTFSSMSTF